MKVLLDVLKGGMPLKRLVTPEKDVVVGHGMPRAQLVEMGFPKSLLKKAVEKGQVKETYVRMQASMRSFFYVETP